MTKLSALLLAVILVVMSFPFSVYPDIQVNASEQLFAGSGMLNDPYLIDSADQLKQLATLINAGDELYEASYYRVVNNLDMSGITEWTPIGTSDHPFTGVFDGGGYSIENLQVSLESVWGSSARSALFDVNNGQIIDTHLTRIDIQLSGSGYQYGAALVLTNNGLVSDCTADGAITATSIYTATGAGLVYSNYGTILRCSSAVTLSFNLDVGQTFRYSSLGGITSYNEGNIIECSFVGMINGTMSGLVDCLVGGIASRNYGRIECCINTGAVTLINKDHYICLGGIVGDNSGPVLNCSNTGPIIGSSISETSLIIGGIAGTIHALGSITNCISSGIVAPGTPSAFTPDVGGIIGKNPPTNHIWNCFYAGELALISGAGGSGGGSLTLAELQDKKYFPGFDFVDVWCYRDGFAYPQLIDVPIRLPEQNSVDYEGGSGTPFDPYRISSLEHLDNVRKNPGACFIMTSDLVFMESDFSDSGRYANGGEGWLPIGQDDLRPFFGVFNGAGHSITGMQITITGTDGVDDYFGLIGYNTGRIMNLNLVDCQVDVSSEYMCSVGTLAGRSRGRIINCTVSGDKGLVSGFGKTGGLVGGVQNGSIVKYCSCDVTVVGSTNMYVGNTGGLAGINYGSVIMCDFTGNVQVKSRMTLSSHYVGGIIGFNYGTIKFSSNTGLVTGAEITLTSTEIGGLAGRNYGSINNSSNAGIVCSPCSTKTTNYTGGLAGSNYGEVAISFNTGFVAAYSGRCGGLVGYGSSNGTISQSYNAGNVECHEGIGQPSSSCDAGGIIGYCGGSVRNCYNSGDVSQNSTGSMPADLGGIVGESSGIIEYCYNTGDLLNMTDTGITACGGIAGTNTKTINNCYFLDNTDFGVVTGLDTAIRNSQDQLTNVDSFSGFDFTNIWLPPVAGVSPPVLRGNIVATGDILLNECTVMVGEKKIIFETLPSGYCLPGFDLASNDRTVAMVNIAQEVVGVSPGTTLITISYTGNGPDEFCLVNVVVPEAVNVVSFDSTGGSFCGNVLVGTNDRISAPTTPTRNGHTFAGWYKDTGLTVPWNFASDAITDHTTLYAKWEIARYTVTFDANGGSSSSSISAEYNTTIPLPAVPQRTGYTFAGWYKSGYPERAWNFTYDVIFDHTTIYAKWIIKQYDVTFDSNGGSSIETARFDYGSAISAPVQPDREGYIFAGWYKDANLTTPWNFSTDVITDHTTLYAKWNIIQFTVTFESNGGSSVSFILADNNGTILAPIPPTRNGHTFAGWYEDAGLTDEWNFSTDMVNGDITLYAKWTVNQYTVIFNSNGGSAVENVLAVYDSLIVAPATPAKPGYSFIGWYKEASLTNKWDFATDRVLEDITLYTAWIQTPTNVKATVTSYNTIQLSWLPTVDAEGYEVWRKLWSSGTLSLVSTQTGTSFSNSGLATNKTYYYKVRAYRMVGTTKVYSKDSAFISVTPIPATPTGLKAASSGYNSAKVSWTAVAGASGYEVYRKLWSSGTLSLVSTQTATSFSNSGLATNKTYYYKVRAYRMVGTTKVYSKDSVFVSVTPVPSAPTGLKVVSGGSKTAKVTWTVVAGASGYEVWRKMWSSGTYAVVSTQTGTSLNNTGLAINKTYYYKVRAYRMVGTTKVYGPDSAAVSYTPLS